jgi:hypothetical protein
MTEVEKQVHEFGLMLSDLPVAEVRRHMMQLNVDLMDYFEQEGPNEKVFVDAHKVYEAWVPDEKAHR